MVSCKSGSWLSGSTEDGVFAAIRSMHRRSDSSLLDYVPIHAFLLAAAEKQSRVGRRDSLHDTAGADGPAVSHYARPCNLLTPLVPSCA
jgi:hypothetical protein